MIKLSGIIIAKNEEEMIADALDSLAFCDEIIVINNDSTDRTAEIAKLLKAKVFTSTHTDFSKLRNFALEKAKGNWVLYIDADERVSKELREAIEQTLAHNPSAAAYCLERKNYFFGNFPWPVTEKLERLFQKSALVEWTGELHESPKIIGAVEDLPGYLLHYTRRDISAMVKKTNQWSETEAKLRFDAHHPPMSSWRFFSVMSRTFFRYYIKDKGYKAGVAGVIESIYQAFSMFITYAKLWELQNNEK